MVDAYCRRCRRTNMSTKQALQLAKDAIVAFGKWTPCDIPLPAWPSDAQHLPRYFEDDKKRVLRKRPREMGDNGASVAVADALDPPTKRQRRHGNIFDDETRDQGPPAADWTDLHVEKTISVSSTTWCLRMFVVEGDVRLFMATDVMCMLHQKRGCHAATHKLRTPTERVAIALPHQDDSRQSVIALTSLGVTRVLKDAKEFDFAGLAQLECALKVAASDE